METYDRTEIDRCVAFLRTLKRGDVLDESEAADLCGQTGSRPSDRNMGAALEHLCGEGEALFVGRDSEHDDLSIYIVSPRLS